MGSKQFRQAKPAKRTKQAKQARLRGDMCYFWDRRDRRRCRDRRRGRGRERENPFIHHYKH